MKRAASTKAKIRYRSLMVLERLGDRVGESLAPFLPLLMPSLVNLMEDENHAVQEKCAQFVNMLQGKFGEHISEGFV